MGHRPLNSIIQKESVSKELRNLLWNGLLTFYWNRLTDDHLRFQIGEVSQLVYRVWGNYLKIRLDQMPTSKKVAMETISDHYFYGQWYSVYDFIEFVLRNYIEQFQDTTNVKFVAHCNEILERELSGYRIVGNTIVPITTEEEMQSVELAMKINDVYLPVKEHLARSMQHLSSRVSPDYRNSIKESISAVESLCMIITSDPKATVGSALKKIEKEHKLHSALKNSFSSLYGYTSEADGIRHGLLEQDELRQEDAIYMLVSCSAFVNYLIKKCASNS